MFNRTDEQFIQQRRRLNDLWPCVGGVLLLSIVGMAAGIAMAYPMVADPVYVVSQLEAGAIDEATLSMAALLLPILFWMLAICLMLFVLLAWQMMRNEKRLLSVLSQREKP